MKHLVTLVAVAALALPAAALAADATPSTSQLAVQSCKTQQSAAPTGMGLATFKLTYGTNKNKSNAFGKCVSKAMQAAQSALQNAAATCKAQQSDSNFAATTGGGKSFDQFYGTNGNASSKGKGAGSNAFGKCVSTITQQTSQAKTDALVGAAKTCKSEGKKGKAFGACVSAKSKQS